MQPEKMVLCNKADSYLCSCGITEADIVQRGKSVPCNVRIQWVMIMFSFTAQLAGSGWQVETV